MILVDETWKKAWPQAHVGIMSVSGVASPPRCEALDEKKDELVRSLRTRFPDKESILSWHTLRTYAEYFKRYKKTYHVLLQLESVACKGKALPSVSPVVEAMFMAELDNAILTAGHDVDKLHLPLRLMAAGGNEKYEGIGGREQDVKERDMIMVDDGGIIASVLGGPDARTKITPQTQRCLFVAYGPPGISSASLERHLDGIRTNMELFLPDLCVEHQAIY